MTSSRLPGSLLALAFCVLGFAGPALAQATPPNGGPYVPTPHAIADRMLSLARVGPGDYLIDLGSGDGRLVIAAVAKHKARGAMGVELDAGLVKRAADEARRAGVADRVRFVAGDLFAADIAQATVVTLYLLPGIMEAVEAKLSKELKPGTRVVSHDYPLPTWVPVEVVTFESPEKVPISGTARTVLRLYRVPGSKPAPPPAPEIGQQSKDSVWVPTPERMIRRMLQLADTTKDDVVVDLGAGDGRIPIYAAKHFGARGIAVELEANLVEVAWKAAAREGVADRVQVVRQDLFEADLSAATVLALYISPGAMQRLKPRFLELAPGTRIASHHFDLGDWEPDEKVEVEGRTGYLWVVPGALHGNWRLKVGGNELRLKIGQRYQQLQASAEREGRSVHVVGARLRGTEIRFTSFDRDGTSRQFVGRVEGDRLVGISHPTVSQQESLPWTAERE